MANETEELPGVPVEGELYKVDDLTGAEQRLLRDVMRETTGNDSATITQFLNLGLIDDFDFACAMTYVVKRRTDEKYTLDQALELKPAEIVAEMQKLEKEARRRPRKAATASSSES